MSRIRTGFIHGSQAPADCKVYGQDQKLNRYQIGWLAAMMLGLIALGVVVNAFWALLDGGVL
jgi:hypothetical protein